MASYDDSPRERQRQLMKNIAAVEAKAAANNITFTMKAGSQVTIKASDTRLGTGTLYGSWVIANAHPAIKDSEGSLGHAIDQAMSGVDGKPFESWEVFKAKHDAEGRTYMDNPTGNTGEDCLIHEDWRNDEMDTVIFVAGDGKKRIVNRNDLHVDYQQFMLQLGAMRELKENATRYYVPFRSFAAFETKYLQTVGVPLIDPCGEGEDENNRYAPPPGFRPGTF